MQIFIKTLSSKSRGIEIDACESTTLADVMIALAIKEGCKNEKEIEEYLREIYLLKGGRKLLDLDKPIAECNITHDCSLDCIIRCNLIPVISSVTKNKIFNAINGKQENISINETQKSIIESFLECPIEEILETFASDSYMSEEALNAMISEKVPENLIKIFKENNLWELIQQVRVILAHPCPQNRTENYPYFGASENENMIVYKDKNGNAAFEQKGLLSLTARNDNNTNVTKEAVVYFIKKSVNEKIVEVKNKKKFDLSTLHSSILKNIFSHLDSKSLLTLDQVNKSLNQKISGSTQLWEDMAIKEKYQISRDKNISAKSFYKSQRTQNITIFSSQLSYFSGTSKTIQINQSETVLSLKNKLKEAHPKFRGMRNDICLTYAGRKLDENKSLHDSGIRGEETIIIYPK